MKRLEFYKPKKTNTGACLTLQFTFGNEDQKKDGLYVNLLRQFSWNEATKNGSFKENVANKENHKKIKLTETEIGNILHVIEEKGNAKFSTVHSRNDTTTQIFFEPYMKETNLLGYIFKVANISIALNMGESRLLKEYLKTGLALSFSASK
jgi:hypothetical protein